MPRSLPKTVLVTGASGQLGQYVLSELVARGITPSAWSGQKIGQVAGVTLEPVSLLDHSLMQARLESLRPEVIIHAGAMSAADDVRKNPDQGRRINTWATGVLAEWASSNKARLIYTSTDLVFDGSKSMWVEEDAASPLLEYGRTKATAEPYVTATAQGLVARVSLLYGPTITGKPSFFTATLDAIRQGHARSILTDEFRTPLDYRSAAEALCSLATTHRDINGVVHLGGPERISRYELLLRSARRLGLNDSLIQPALASETPMPEPRPRDVSLLTQKMRSVLPEIRVRFVEDVIYEML